MCQAFVADVKGAFTKGLRGQRPGRLIATPPPGGIPGETRKILFEILAEIYSLVSGPAGWRRIVSTTLDSCGFHRHPLAPCVVLKFEKKDLVGLVCIEADDFLG